MLFLIMKFSSMYLRVHIFYSEIIHRKPELHAFFNRGDMSKTKAPSAHGDWEVRLQWG